MQSELWWQLLEVVNVGMFQVTTKATVSLHPIQKGGWFNRACSFFPNA